MQSHFIYNMAFIVHENLCLSIYIESAKNHNSYELEFGVVLYISFAVYLFDFIL